MQNKVHILSTRDLSAELRQQAADVNIVTDIIPFIKTESAVTQQIIADLYDLQKENINAVFTSMNAVEFVSYNVHADVKWNIYCIGSSTKDLVEKYFYNSALKGTAANASELADRIIKDECSAVYFFCGDIRRDELPEKLKQNGIEVNEVVVYHTKETPQVISQQYDAVLFFSPSAVRSFFSMNKVSEQTILFAIGETTQKLGVKRIHSEYGMTELLSQAYSKGNGLFECPPWMKVLIREEDDPLMVHTAPKIPKHSRNGLINVIDLGNIHSCAFIATEDVGRLYSDEKFEVLGRSDNSDIRGCSLMVV